MIITSDYESSNDYSEPSFGWGEIVASPYSHNVNRVKDVPNGNLNWQKLFKSTNQKFSRDLALLYFENFNIQLIDNAGIDLKKNFSSNEFVEEDIIVPVFIKCFLKHAIARFVYIESKYYENRVPKKYLIMLHNSQFLCYVVRDICKKISDSWNKEFHFSDECIQWTEEIENSFSEINTELNTKYYYFNAYHKVSKIRDWLLNNVFPYDFFEKAVAYDKFGNIREDASGKMLFSDEYHNSKEVFLYKKLLVTLRLYFLQNEVYNILSLIKDNSNGKQDAIHYFKTLYLNKNNSQYKSISKTNPKWSYLKKSLPLFDYYPLFAKKMIISYFYKSEEQKSYSLNTIKNGIIGYFNSVADTLDDRAS